MAFSDPQTILDRFGVHEGQVIADLGAGSGFYSIAAAKMVGRSGTVYAIEVQEEVLRRLANHAHHERAVNIHSIHADMEQLGGTKIADRTVDSALVCNVLFQVEDKPGFLAEVKRILKPGGRVLVVDWADSFGGTGPQPQYVVKPEKARELFAAGGFTEVPALSASISGSAGDHHYALVFRK
jgi:ubiquinone/menaquinone biosynthesis C-methylase UbiE